MTNSILLSLGTRWRILEGYSFDFTVQICKMLSIWHDISNLKERVIYQEYAIALLCQSHTGNMAVSIQLKELPA